MGASARKGADGRTRAPSKQADRQTGERVQGGGQADEHTGVDSGQTSGQWADKCRNTKTQENPK